MESKAACLSVVLGLVLATPAAWAAMSNAQAQALVATAFTQSGSARGVAALDKLTHAAKAGVPAAQLRLGELFCGNGRYARGNYWYRKAAEQGNAEAQFNLGGDYDYGQGMPRDAVKAAYWYRKAAERGYVEAQFNLASLYDYGQGVPKNRTRAAYWFAKAAAQGDAVAKHRLASLEDQQPSAGDQARVQISPF